MKKFSLLVSAVSAAFVVGCSSVVGPGMTNVAVTNAEAKSGSSTCTWVLGFRTRTCSIDEAIKKADITQVQTINIEFFNALFFRTQTISVRGK